MATKRALRKLRRRLESDAYAKEARFWRKLKSADRLGYDKPVNRLAARELTHNKSRSGK